MTKTILVALSAALMLGASASAADPGPNPQDRDPYGYYSRYDHDGYYDREGNYVRFRDQRRSDDAAPPPPAPAPVAYSAGRYEEQCRAGNTTAGTLFGALAGGLLGGAASSGRHHGPDGAAVVGGAIMGGLVGNALTRDIPCEDHAPAMRVYADGLNGDVGRSYTWRHEDDYGVFVPEREFLRSGYTCRSFTETTYVRGRKYVQSGTACRQRDGYWHFD